MEVYKLYYDGILEIGKCKLADETVFERSGYFYTSFRANVGTTLTAFSILRTLLQKYSLPCIFHALFCTSKDFYCLEEDAGGGKIRPGKTLRRRPALRHVQQIKRSDFLRNLECGELRLLKFIRNQPFYVNYFIRLNLNLHCPALRFQHSVSAISRLSVSFYCVVTQCRNGERNVDFFHCNR